MKFTKKKILAVGAAVMMMASLATLASAATPTVIGTPMEAEIISSENDAPRIMMDVEILPEDAVISFADDETVDADIKDALAVELTAVPSDAMAVEMTVIPSDANTQGE